MPLVNTLRLCAGFDAALLNDLAHHAPKHPADNRARQDRCHDAVHAPGDVARAIGAKGGKTFANTLLG